MLATRHLEDSKRVGAFGGTTTGGLAYRVAGGRFGRSGGRRRFALMAVQAMLAGAGLTAVEASAAAAELSIADVSGTAMIKDDDGAVVASNRTFGLYVQNGTVNEGDSAQTIRVRVTDNAISRSWTLDGTLSVGKSGDGATEGTDYQTVGDVSFTMTSTEKTKWVNFTLTPKQDTAVEGNESITLTISGGGYTTRTGTMTLSDDEITLTSSVASVNERDPATTVTVTATPASTTGSARTVSVSVGKSNDSATEGTDYATVANFNVTIAANASSGTGTFTLTPTQDTSAEGDESISISGSISGGATVIGTTMNLYDDDISLSVNPSTVDEEGGAKTITVTATGGPTTSRRTVRVSVGKSGDNAAEGTDYKTVWDFNITLPIGETSHTGTFTLTPLNDATYEPYDAISITGTAPGLSVSSTRVMIDDDDSDPDIQVTLNKSSVSENGGAQTITVTATDTRDNPPGDVDAPIEVGRVQDSATEGTDYATVNQFTIRIPSTSQNTKRASGTFTLTPTNDSTPEGTERIAVYVSTHLYSGGEAFISLTDDDGGSITLSTNTSSVSEGASKTTVTVTATANKNVSAARTVTVRPGQGGSAVHGTDYSVGSSSFAITIPSGGKSATGTFQLTPTQDKLVEGNETIAIEGNATGFSIIGTSVTLSDDDAAPAVNLSVSPTSVGEGASGTKVDVTAAFSNTNTYASDKTVTISVGGSGTATSGTDYTAVSNFNITISKGQTSGTGSFTLTPTNDTTAEDHETIGVAGTSTGLTVNGATLTLNDNDNDAVTLSADTSSVAEDGNKTTVTVTATATTSLNRGRTVVVAVGSASDSATEGTDYTTVADFNITIAANATSGTGTFALSPTQDTSAEGDESIGISGSGTLITVTGTSITLTDDDTRTIALSVNKTTVGEGAGATTVTVTATAASAVTEATKVTVSVGASGDGATEGTDYTTVADFDITFAANTTTKTGTFTLTPTDDTTYEGEESVSISGSSSPHTVTGTSLAIGNNDGIGITLSVSPTSVVEGAGSTSVTVTATAAKTALAAITLDVQVGKSSDSATEGTDYPTVNDFNLTIAKGSKTGTATFHVIPNSDKKTSEGNETISVDGTSSPHTVTGTSLTLTNATASNPITLSVSPSSVGEGAGETTVNVTAKMQTSFVKAGDMTVTVGTGGSAKSGTDYAAVSDITLTFAANSTTATGSFKLTPTDDSLVESNETVWVDGSSSQGEVVGASVTINDNDGSAVTLSADTTSVGEGASAKTVTVTATPQNVGSNARTVTVAVGSTGDGAIEGTDYSTVADFDITIAANASSATGTFTLTPTQDTEIEGSESLTISGSGTGLNVTGTSVNLTDDDTAPAVNLSVSPTSVTEGASDPQNLLGSYKSVTVTATFSSSNTYASDQLVAVSIGGTGSGSGTATQGTDYTAVSNFNVKIAAGATSGTGTFQLASTDDSVYEGDETIGVAGTSTGLTVNSVDLTLADNDSAAVTVDDASATEGSDITFTVTLDTAVQGGLTVTPSFTDDTATEGTDYDENTAALTFDGTADETETFTVSTTQDFYFEGDETFTVALAVSDAPTGVTATDTGTGTIDNDETAPAVNLSLDTTSVLEDAADTTVTVTATLSSSVRFPEDRKVTVSVGASDDTAVSGTNYAAVTDFDITIIKGEGSGTATFTLDPTDNSLDEADKSITVSGTSTGLTVNSTSLALNDDEGTPSVNLSLSTTSVAENAADTTVTVTATLSNSSRFAADRTVTVKVGKSDDTATSGTDYAAVTDFDITIDAGEGSGTATFTLDPSDNSVDAADKSITVSGTSTGLTVTSASLSLTDDDATPAVNLSVDPTAVAEDASTTTVTVTAALSTSIRFPEDRKVTVSVGASGDTATSGTDYAAVANFDVTIKKGDGSGTATFSLDPTDNNIDAADKSITVSGTSTGLTVNSASLTLNDDDGTPSVNLSLSPSGVAEDAAATDVTVTAALSSSIRFAEDKTVSVSVGASGDTATSGTDYAAVTSFDIKITAGAASGSATFSLNPTDNNVDAVDKSITVSGTSSGLMVNSATLTLNDDDGTPAVNLSLNPASVAEDASATTVTVTAALSTSIRFAADRTVTVSVGSSGDTATSGTDYAAVTDFDITIAKGEGSGTATFTLTPTDNSIDAADKSITVSGTSTGLTVNSASLALTDDDGTPAVDLSLGPIGVAEDASGTTITVTATLSNASRFADDRTVAVSVGKSGDTATSGTDYAAVPDFDVTIDAGEGSGTATFTLTPTDNNNHDGDKSITVSGTSTGLTVNPATLALYEDDDAPTVNLAANPTSVVEDMGATSVTVTASLSTSVRFATDRTVTVTVGKSDDSAVSGTDYAPVTDFDVTIKAGKGGGEATFTLTPTQDTLLEASEWITVSGQSTGLEVKKTTMTLVDTPQQSAIQAIKLSASPSSVSEDAGATTVTVTAQASDGYAFGQDTTVTVAVGAGGDSAVSGHDYAAVADFDIAIAAGESGGTAKFTLTPTADAYIEGTESLTISGATAVLDVDIESADVTITEAAGTPTVDRVTFSVVTDPGEVPEDGGAQTITVTAWIGGGGVFEQDREVIVDVDPGTAKPDEDYRAYGVRPITIPAGEEEGSATFTLDVVDDAVLEGDEYLEVEGRLRGVGRDIAQLHIVDDDEVSVRVSDARASEGGNLLFAVSLGDTAAVPVALGYETRDGSATAGADYAAASGVLAIPAGETSATVSVATLDDDLPEPEERMALALVAPPGGLLRGVRLDGDGVAAGMIESDDVATISVAPATAAEGSELAFGISLSAAAPESIRVAYSTADGSATAGEDYAAASGLLTIPAGAASATVAVATAGDDLPELDETLTLSLSAPAGGLPPWARVDVGVAGGTILNDDIVSVSVAPASAREGAELSFGVTLSAVAGAPVEIAYATADGTATAGTDYAAASGVLTIPAGATSGAIAVATTADDSPEPDETLTLSLSAPAGGLPPWARVDVGVAGGTILNDDIVSVSVAPASAREGAELSFGVTLSAVAGAPVEIAYATADGTATAGTDYAAASGVLTIPAGAASATVAVATADDDLPELDETLTLSLSAPAGGLPPWARVDVGVAGGTILNDDIVSVSVAPASAQEGADLSFEVALSLAADDPVEIAYATADGTAIAGTDYAAASGVATIPAGATSGAIVVATTADDSPEPDETLTLTLSAPAGGLPAWARVDVGVAEGTILNDDIVSVSVAPASAQEGADLAFEVSLSTAADDPVRIAYATADGTAAAGDDYAAASGALTVPAGSLSATVAVSTVADALAEPDETLTLSISAPSGGLPPWARVDNATAGGTILNDDIATVSVSPASAREGENLSFAVSLSTPAAGPVSLLYSTEDGTATAGDDYAAADGRLDIAAGATTATLAVAALEDGWAEGDETLWLSLSADGLPAAVELGAARAAGTILDIDAGEVRVASARAAEGERLRFEVTLSAPSASDTALSWSTADGTAKASEKDYVAVSGGTLTIAAGGRSARLEVASVADLFVEPDETFEVRLAARGELPANVSIGAGEATGTIGDDDGETAARLGNVHEPILADLSLAMTESVVDAISGRIEEASWGPARRFEHGAAGMGGVSGMSPLGGLGMASPDGFGASPLGGFGADSQGTFGVAPRGAFGAVSDGGFGPVPLAALGMSGAELRSLSETGGAPRAGRLSARGKLGGMSFRYAVGDLDDRGEDASADVELWGRADLRPLGGSHDYAAGGSVAWDGAVLGVVVGADRRVRPGLLAGLAASRFDSEFDYVAQEGGDEFDGVYRASMTSLHPYANWTATPRLDLWAAGGFGEGRIQFEEEGAFGSQRADSDWLTGAAGGEFLLTATANLIPGGVTTLDIKADAFATRLEVENNGELVESLGVDANRLRLALVGEYSWLADSGAELAPSLELAARRDGGDGETGAGVELGAKLRYASPGGRLSIDARAHVLAAFGGDKREWGVGGALQLAPGPEGRGWSLVLSPSYGPTVMGVQGMWQQRPQQRPARGATGLGASGARFDGEAGHGFRIRGGLLTVLTGFSWHETGTPRQTVGALLRHRGMDLRFDFERSESPEGLEHGVMLRAEKVIGAGAAPQYGAD